MEAIVGVDFDDVKLGTFAFWSVPIYPFIEGGVINNIHPDQKGSPMHGHVQVLEHPDVWLEPKLFTDDEESAMKLLKAIEELKKYRLVAVADLHAALDIERRILLNEAMVQTFKDPAEEEE